MYHPVFLSYIPVWQNNQTKNGKEKKNYIFHASEYLIIITCQRKTWLL